MKARRCRKEDLFAGRVIYFVSACIRKDPRLNSISITERTVAGRPKANRYSVFVPMKLEPGQCRLFHGSHSLRDWGVVHRNERLSTPAVHRIFTKRKQAEKYRARLMSGCYNANERDLVQWHSVHGDWNRPPFHRIGKLIRAPRCDY
jgi:hypothetical protein